MSYTHTHTHTHRAPSSQTQRLLQYPGMCPLAWVYTHTHTGSRSHTPYHARARMGCVRPCKLMLCLSVCVCVSSQCPGPQDPWQLQGLLQGVCMCVCVCVCACVHKLRLSPVPLRVEKLHV